MEVAEALYGELVEGGAAAVEAMIGREEDLHLDFKQKRNSAEGRIDDTDRRIFSEACSGFANSNGGLVVWGIKADRDDSGVDVANELKPITDPMRFCNDLNKECCRNTDPSVPRVGNAALPREGENDGYVVSFIAASDHRPHRAAVKDKDHGKQYWKRAGDSFIACEHYDIADMFLRRQKPRLALKPQVRLGKVSADVNAGVATRRWSVDVDMLNEGNVTAKLPGAVLQVEAPYHVDPESVLRKEPPGQKPIGIEEVVNCLGGPLDYIHPGWRKTIAKTVEVGTTGDDPIRDVVFRFTLFAEDTPGVEDTLTLTGEEIREVLKNS